MARLIQVITVLAFVASLVPVLRTGEPDLTRLLDLLDKTTFTAYGEEDIRSSRQSVLAALEDIPIELNEDDYLESEELSTRLLENSEDNAIVTDEEVIEILQYVIEVLEKDLSPNENARFLKLRKVARHHVMLVADHQDEKLAASFAERKADLQHALKEYALEPSAQQRRIAAHVRWCRKHEQALEFVAAAKQELSHPNLEIRLSAPFIRTLTERASNQSVPIDRRESDGIRTLGTTDFSGHGYLQPSASTGNGSVNVQFRGKINIHATTKGVRFHFGSRATTSIDAVAKVTFDNQGLMTAGIPQVDVRTALDNSAVTVHWPCEFGKWLIGFMTELKIACKSSEVKAALSDGAAQRVRKELNAQLDELLERANSLRNTVWKRAQRLDLDPGFFSVQTTDTELKLILTEDAACGLAAPGPSAAAAAGSDVIAIHESLATDLLNRFFLRHIGSRSINVHSLQRLNDALSLNILGKSNYSDEQEAKIELQLDYARPFEIGFQENMISLTFRAAQVSLDGNTFPAHNLSLDYRVSFQPDGNVEFDFQGRRLTPLDPAMGDAIPELVEAFDNEFLVDLQPTFALNLNEIKLGGMELPLEIRGVTANQDWLAASFAARPIPPTDTSKQISEIEPNAPITSRPKAEPNIASSRAFLKVNVPAEAVVFVNGKQTKISGDTRKYFTRKLKLGLKYRCEIRAEVTRNGHKLSQVKVIDLQAGLTNELAFDFNDAEPVTTSLTLNVPANANVRLGGVETMAKGSTRTFTTTRLNVGDLWSDYKVVVTVERDGRLITREWTLHLKAGDNVKLDFDFGLAAETKIR